MALPRRPSQHQIEDVSRRKFREKCPPAWVVRDLDPDYGIDMLVDIFENDEATGRSFYVQMKSTGEENLGRALAVRLTAAQAALYRSVDLPVLIALYVQSVDKVFVRWFHTYDPHYEARASDGMQESFTFRLAEADEWVESTPEALSRVTIAYRRIRSPDLPLPLRFYLVQPDDRVHGAASAEHLNAVRRAAEALRDFVVFQAGTPPAGEPSVLVEPTAIAANLGGIASTTGHYAEDITADRWAESFPYDVLVLIALTFDHIGQTSLAAPIAAQGAGRSKLVADPEVAFRLSGLFARSRRFMEAIQVAEALDGSDDADVWIAGDVILAACQAYEMPARDSEAYIVALESRIDRRLARGDMGSAAATQYTLGNFLYYTMGEPRQALLCYRRAAKSDPTYRVRGYFYRDVGRILSALGRPGFAAEAYVRALDLGMEGMTRAFLADALLSAGRLCEAQEAFDQYLDEESDAPPEWRLKRFVLSRLREAAGDSVRRLPQEAIDLASSVNLDEGIDDEGIAALSAAIEADILCGFAWFHLGLFRADHDPDAAADACLIGALTTLKGEPGAWATAAVLAWGNPSRRNLVDDILWNGYHLVGQSLVDLFSEVPDDQQVHDWREFLAAVEGAIAAEEARLLADQGFEMRFFSTESEESLSLDIRRGPPAD